MYEQIEGSFAAGSIANVVGPHVVNMFEHLR
jgi:hypothetical protein